MSKLLLALPLLFLTACTMEVPDDAPTDVATEAPITVAPAAPAPASPATTLVRVAPAPRVSTRLTVRWTRGGPAEVIGAVELPGLLKVETGMKRRYLAVVRLAGEVKSVVPFDADFEERATGGDEADEIPDRRTSETFVADVPGIGLDQASALDVQVLEIVAPHTQRVASAAAVDLLTRESAVRTVAAIDSSRISSFIRLSGRRIATPTIVDLE